MRLPLASCFDSFVEFYFIPLPLSLPLLYLCMLMPNCKESWSLLTSIDTESTRKWYVAVQKRKGGWEFIFESRFYNCKGQYGCFQNDPNLRQAIGDSTHCIHWCVALHARCITMANGMLLTPAWIKLVSDVDVFHH